MAIGLALRARAPRLLLNVNLKISRQIKPISKLNLSLALSSIFDNYCGGTTNLFRSISKHSLKTLSQPKKQNERSKNTLILAPVNALCRHFWGPKASANPTTAQSYTVHCVQSTAQWLFLTLFKGPVQQDFRPVVFIIRACLGHWVMG